MRNPNELRRIEIEVPGDVRPYRDEIKRRGKHSRVEKTDNVKANEATIAIFAARAMEEAGLDSHLVGPVRVTLLVYVPRPKTPKRDRGLTTRKTTQPDACKIIRTVNDALTDVVFADDREVSDLVVGKRYGPWGSQKRTFIRVEELEELLPEVRPKSVTVEMNEKVRVILPNPAG